MTGSGEPSLYALSIDPRTARAGDVVEIVFRTRNLGTRPTPSASVHFALGEGLEPLDAVECAVDPVAPGEDVVAAIRARVLPPPSPESKVAVGAALHVAGSVLVCNRCTLTVRGRPVLDGGASGASVEALGHDTARVRAVVTNEGDGPACTVRLTVPAPIGCVRVDGDGPALLELERLDPGERAELTFEARVVEPVAEIRADDGELRLAGGRRIALPARDVVATVAVLAAPRVAVVPSRRRLDVTVDLRNDGWADARDAGVRIAASGASLDMGSILIDGVPPARTSRTRARRDAAMKALASIRRDGDAATVDLALIPARASVRITLAATPLAATADGTFAVSAGRHAIEVPYVVPQVRDVRLRVIEAPRRVAPGEVASVVVRVSNAGDVDENVTVAIEGDAAAERSEPADCALRPGSFADIALDVAVPEAPPGDAFHLAVTAFDSTGERARVSAAISVRHRPSLAVEPIPALEDDDGRGIAALVHAVLHAPPAAVAGAPVGIHLDLDVEDAADAIVIRTRPPQGTRYVAGSTRLDDRALLDRTRAGAADAISPLDGEGLTLRAVPAGTRVTLGWSLLTDPALDAATVDVTALLEVDGEPRVVSPASVDVRAREPFAARPAGLRYHVEACSVGPAADRVDEPPPSPAPIAFAPEPPDEREPAGVDVAPPTFSLSLGRARVDELERLLHGAHGTGLVAHLFALRLLFADRIDTSDAALAEAFDALNAAMRDVYDRLFVKLRIPGFAACADDLEDPALRAALVAACNRTGGAAFAGMPLGAPAALRALVALRPSRCDDDPALAAAIARYAELIDGVLAGYEDLPLELFDDALARRADAALDEARGALLAALHPHLIPAEVAC